MNLKKQNKSYPINASRFYALKGIGQLEKLLNIKLEPLEALLSKENSYNVFINNDREVQQPIGKMRSIHDRIANLLSRIQTPNYLTSKKGFSYIDNAKMHLGNSKLIKTDISKFYPNTNFEKVHRMFIERFKCAKDIATILAKICCFQQKHLPIGSPLSGFVAFFCAKNMFDEIQQIGNPHNCTLSVYVDDIAVSGNEANGIMLHNIRTTIKKYNYSTKRKKSKIYSENQPKPLTGTIINGQTLQLPNKRHKKIWETQIAHNKEQNPEQKQIIKKRLTSMKREASRLDN